MLVYAATVISTKLWCRVLFANYSIEKSHKRSNEQTMTITSSYFDRRHRFLFQLNQIVNFGDCWNWTFLLRERFFPSVILLLFHKILRNVVGSFLVKTAEFHPLIQTGSSIIFINNNCIGNVFLVPWFYFSSFVTVQSK